MTVHDRSRATSAAEALALVEVDKERAHFERVLQGAPATLAVPPTAPWHHLSNELDLSMDTIVQAHIRLVYARLHRLRPDLADLFILACWHDAANHPDWLPEDLAPPVPNSTPGCGVGLSGEGAAS